MVKYIKHIFVPLVAVVILLSSCDYKSKKNISDYQIGIVPKERGSSFWKVLRKGSYEATKDLLEKNISVELIWQAPAGINQWEDQIKYVEHLVDEGVDGILLAPINRQVLLSSLQSADKKNIPVIVIDTPILEGNYISYIGSDNYEAGVRAGHYLALLLEETGNVIILRHMEGSVSTQEREEGFLEAIEEYSEIEVISSHRYGGGSQESAFMESQKLLSKSEKLGIDGIFTSSQSSTNGMIFALQKFPEVQKHNYFIGFDGGYLNIRALNDGDIDGLLVQDPEGMGYEGVMKMVSYLKKNSIAKQIHSDVILLDEDNILEKNIQKFLEPYFQEFSYD